MTEAGGWTPDKDTVEHANITRFLAWLAETGRGDFADYPQLWSESVRDVDWFWDAVWHFFDVQATTPPTRASGAGKCLARNGFRGRR